MKCLWQIDDYEVHIFSLPVIDSRMYCIKYGKEALIVDPCVGDDVIKLLGDIEYATVLLTHEHIDHISGVNIIRTFVGNCNVICSRKCADSIINPRKNLAKYLDAMFCVREEYEQAIIRNLNLYEYTCQADKVFDEEYDFYWNDLSVKCIEMPGHSKGSIGIFINEKYFFSGDSLLDGIPVITVLPGGSKKDFINITKPMIECLSEGTVVFPGHGDVFVCSPLGTIES